MQIRRMSADDVQDVIRCFESCYGHTYIESFYDPDWMRDQIRTGRMRSVVAVDEAAGIVGHTALKLMHEGALACEVGSSVVMPAFRNRGLMKTMARDLMVICREDGFVGNINEPTTAHAIMQKGSTEGGSVETGIMLELIPANAEFRGFDRQPGRLAVTVVYQPLAEAPEREIWAPERYRTLIEELYGEIGLPRTVRSAGSPAPPDMPRTSLVEETYSRQHRLRQIFIERIGADLAEILDSPDAGLVEVRHVDLCLDEQAVGWAVSLLTERGFFYCALEPETARTDVLRLQRLDRPGPEAFEPFVVNQGAKRLLSRMRTEASVS